MASSLKFSVLSAPVAVRSVAAKAQKPSASPMAMAKRYVGYADMCMGS
jgi:hypothetical protein